MAVGVAAFEKVWRQKGGMSSPYVGGSWNWKLRSCATPDELAKADSAWADFVNSLEEAV